MRFSESQSYDPEARVYFDVIGQGGSNWMDEAACTNHPHAEWWFPSSGNMSAAAAVCARCPVRLECLDYAITNEIEEGCWGGLSAKERSKTARAHRRAQAS